MMQQYKPSKSHFVLLMIFAVALAAGTRLIDHPANFVPLGAIAMLSAFYLKSRWSFVIPIAALLLSDFVLGGYHWQIMLAVYGAYLLMWGIGRMAASQQTRWALVPGFLFGSLFHFFLTNAAVWAFSGMYEPNVSGLLLSYTMAIPFFKWTLAGDLFYGASILGIIEGARFVASKASLKTTVEQHLI